VVIIVTQNTHLSQNTIIIWTF